MRRSSTGWAIGPAGLLTSSKPDELPLPAQPGTSGLPALKRHVVVHRREVGHRIVGFSVSSLYGNRVERRLVALINKLADRGLGSVSGSGRVITSNNFGSVSGPQPDHRHLSWLHPLDCRGVCVGADSRY